MSLQTAGKRVLIVRGGKAGRCDSPAQRCRPSPRRRETSSPTTGCAARVQSALAALRLTSSDRGGRLAAAKELSATRARRCCRSCVKALEKEQRSRDPSAARADRGGPATENRDGEQRNRGDRTPSPARRVEHIGRFSQSLLGSRDRTPARVAKKKACARSTARRVASACRARVRRHLARLGPAARRARPRDHLRPHGRHQHGARRAHHDRRLLDVRRSEPLPRACAGRIRLVSRRGDPGLVLYRGR